MAVIVYFASPNLIVKIQLTHADRFEVKPWLRGRLFECLVEEEHAVLRKAELSMEADSENYLGGSSERICTTSDLTFTRRRLLLREGCGWSCAPERQDRIDPARAGCLDHHAAISYCGLCADEKNSANKVMRMPLSKQRNKHIQRVLFEAAKLTPKEPPELAMIRARELERGNPNRATLAVARKMVCYMMAVERRQQDFVPAEKIMPTAAA
jgi:hypothetical protein